MTEKSCFLSPAGSGYTGKSIGSNGHGVGILFSYEKITYVGGFNGGRPNGYGTLTTPTGTTYQGNWKEGVLDGKVECHFANGNTYVGGLKNKRPNGMGIFTWASGERIEGRWQDGLYYGIRGLTDPFIPHNSLV